RRTTSASSQSPPPPAPARGPSYPNCGGGNLNTTCSQARWCHDDIDRLSTTKPSARAARDLRAADVLVGSGDAAAAGSDVLIDENLRVSVARDGDGSAGLKLPCSPGGDWRAWET